MTHPASIRRRTYLRNRLIPSRALTAAKPADAMPVANLREERFAHCKQWPLGEPFPGQRQSVKAASREAVARPATALTDCRWSGLFATSGLALHPSKVEWMALGSLMYWMN